MAVTEKKTKRKASTSKRLKRVRDWQAWAWRFEDGFFAFTLAEEEEKPTYKFANDEGGKWVRVRFVEVPPRKRGD